MSTDIESFIFDLSRELRIEDTQGVSGNELELIALIKNCPFLYDKSRKDFKDLEKREATWRAIATVMHSSVLDCQARWKCLREAYGRIKRSLNLPNPDIRLSQWDYLEDMKFLEPHIKPRRSKREYVVMPDFEDESYNIEWLDEPKCSDSKDVKLIGLVRSFPMLYDKRNEDYKDAIKKAATWSSIAAKMDCSVSDTQVRWKALREKYARERKLKKFDPLHKDWNFFPLMSFLDGHVRERNTRMYTLLPPKLEVFDNSDSSPSQVINSQINNDIGYQVQKLEFVDPTYDHSVTNVDSGNPVCVSPISVIESSKCETSSKNSAVPDEDDLFGQSIAAELKKISGRRKKIKLKADIFKLLYDYECDD